MASATLINGTARLTVDLDDDCEALDRIIDLYRDSLNIPEGANVAVNGEDVSPEDYDNVELQDGDRVTISKTTGAKG